MAINGLDTTFLDYHGLQTFKTELDALFNQKVSKVTGKGLSTNDYTNADKALVQGAIQDVSGKVDKVEGKGLSTNDFTDAYQTLINEAVQSSEKGSPSGVATLDANGKVPSSQLPSYVDDVVEYATRSSFPAEGETGKIYVDLSTNLTYRWGGSEYVGISTDLALGETSSTAYWGDRGKVAYDHAVAKGNAYVVGLYKFGTNSEGHVASATPLVAADITALGIPAQDTTYENKLAVEAGTDVSLVTTGDKYNWNHKADVSIVPTKTSSLQNDSGFITSSEKGIINGIATLGSDGKVPSSQLPAGQASVYAWVENETLFITMDERGA